MRALTGMRFLAAAAVVGVHLDYWFGFTGPVHAVLRNGNLGVTFFFVLSGFVLTTGFRRERLRDFYRRRLARVYPLHLITWSACLVLLPNAGVAALREYSAGLLFLQGVGPASGHVSRLNHPAWSLTCEAFFYALFPLLVVMVLRQTQTSLVWWLIACGLATGAADALVCLTFPSAEAQALTTYFPPLRLGEFMSGVLLARLVASGWRPPHILVATATVSAACLVVFAVPTMALRQLCALPCALVLIAWGARANSWIASPLMVRLGQQSYALYLSHTLVYLGVIPHLSGDRTTRLIVLASVMLLVAAALHHGAEAPLERLLRPGGCTRSELSTRDSPLASPTAVMVAMEPTADPDYAAYLQRSWWKRAIRPVDPYLRRMSRQRLGRTLDVGCGVGRNLATLRPGSVGVDHNADSVRHARSMGLDALTVEEFLARNYPAESFDSVLLAHVLEHMNEETGAQLVATYLPYLRPGGTVLLICPQERGFGSDPTHVRWTTDTDLTELCQSLGLELLSSSSFPLPRWAGKRFTYNEFWVRAMAGPASYED